MLQDLQPEVRKGSLEVFLHMGPAAAAHAPGVAACLYDEDAGVRLMAARALGNMGPAARPHAEELVKEMCNDESSGHRLAAAALAQLGKVGASALANLLRHRNPGVQTAARLALQDMGEVAEDVLRCNC